MEKRQAWGLLLLRVAMGLGFMVHGFDKFNGGIENTSNWFESMGLPGILAYGVALLEVMGGLALITGLATRLVSALLAIVMIVAIIKVKFAGGVVGLVGFELELIYFIISIVLLLNGSGTYSIDRALFPSINNSRKTSVQ